MKHFFALLMTCICFAGFSQFPSVPYNPDDNNDGLIGVADLQALLALYSQEFSSAILSDNGNIAVVEVAATDLYRCRANCASLPGAWSIVDQINVGLILDQISADNFSTWVEIQNSVNYPAFGINPNGEVQYVTWANTRLPKRCFCAAKQRPKVEYSFCSGNDPSNGEFNLCISEKLAEGWYPLSGFPNHHDKQTSGYTASFQNITHASFWRWEQ